MDWILALFMIWGQLTGAAEAHAKAEAIELKLQQEAMVRAEAVLFQDQADTVMSADTIILPNVTYPGDVVMVRSQTAGEVTWKSKAYPLISFKNGYYTYIPIPVETKPGTYTVAGKELIVKAKTFDVSRLTVTQEQAQMQQNTERINADQKKINLARSTTEPTFISTAPFVIPVEGRLSTPYGYTRFVNGVFSGSHLAIDLAAPTGTPVKATNGGKVVLAEILYLTGNAIYIDHGMNLFSQYAHLSRLDVKVGDIVTAGEVIGLVGSTGFSTGPHLHFTFWVGNTPVNPNLFFNSTPFQWLTK